MPNVIKPFLDHDFVKEIKERSSVKVFWAARIVFLDLEKSSGRFIGVAPDVMIADALVLNGERGGTDAQILAGIQWAIDQTWI